MKKIVTISLAIVSALSSCSRTYAYETNRNQINEIFIKGISENSTFYIGADIEIDADVNEDSVDKNIDWILNNSNIIELNKHDNDSNEANIRAINNGEVEVMARSKDDRFISREVNLKVENYPNDDESMSLISSNIVPIQCIGILDKVLQIEVNRNISVDEKINSIDNYLKKIKLLGRLNLESINKENKKYEFYKISILGKANLKLEIRVDVSDASYLKIKDMMMNLGFYNNLDEPNIESIPKEEITQNLEGIVVLEGNGLNEDDPIKIEVNKKLSSEEKIVVMKKYLELIQNNNTLTTVNTYETDEFTAYKMRVSHINEGSTYKNDFFIELIIDKEDEHSHKVIISMLENLGKKNDESTNTNDQQLDLEGTHNNKEDSKLDDNKVEIESTHNNNNDSNKEDNKVNIKNTYSIKEDNEENTKNNIINLDTNDINKVKNKMGNLERIKNKDALTNIENIIQNKEENNEDKLILTTFVGASLSGVMLGGTSFKRIRFKNKQ